MKHSRVIGADGSLEGFGGGLYAKEYMLKPEREGLAKNNGTGN